MSNKVSVANKTFLGKSVSWVCIFWGFTAVLGSFFSALYDDNSSCFQIIYFLIIGFTSIFSGYFGLKFKPLAFFLITLVFAPQIIIFSTPEFHYDLTGYLKAGLGFGWHDILFVYFNLLAISIFLISALNVFKLTEPDIVD